MAYWWSPGWWTSSLIAIIPAIIVYQSLTTTYFPRPIPNRRFVEDVANQQTEIPDSAFRQGLEALENELDSRDGFTLTEVDYFRLYTSRFAKWGPMYVFGFFYTTKDDATYFRRASVWGDSTILEPQKAVPPGHGRPGMELWSNKMDDPDTDTSTQQAMRIADSIMRTNP